MKVALAENLRDEAANWRPATGAAARRTRTAMILRIDISDGAEGV